MAQESNTKKRVTYVKSKNESVDNIIAFYALGSASESILKSKVIPKSIQYKAKTKALVTFTYEGDKPTKDNQTNIVSLLNQMIGSNTKIESKTINRADLNENDISSIPDNIDSSVETLYQLSITNGLSSTPYVGFSHLPLPQTLGFLNNFRIIKLNVKKSKLQVQFEVSSGSSTVTTNGTNESNKNKKVSKKGKGVNNNNNIETDEKVDGIINRVTRKDNSSTQKNELLEYSQDIVDKILYNLRNELNVELSETKIDEMVNDTRLLLNQFQSLTYTRALFAQQGMKRM